MSMLLRRLHSGCAAAYGVGILVLVSLYSWACTVFQCSGDEGSTQ
jgi:hypothetical protein